MRKLVLTLLICLMVLLVASVSFASLNQFAGKWTNVDKNTRGITTLDIQVNGNDVSVQAWGSCQPTDCDWGRVTGYAYAPNVSSNLAATAQAVSAVYQTGFSQTTLIIKPLGNQLQAQVLTRFTDGSGRSNYTATYNFNRSINLKPIGPINPGQFKPLALGTPQQVSPQSGSVFNYFPRKTTLQWKAVPGAASYTVEVDCFQCCQTGAWCTDVGQTFKIVPGLTATYYTFDFVGAQPGRWRVWAVGSNGQESAKSGWWEFKYTK